MSPLDVLQMLGRAGRPGYDDVGYAHVVCDGSEAGKYRTLLRDGKEIESRLAGELDAHLNAEIALGTVADVSEVVEWLETTFLSVRAEAAPESYPTGLRERASETLERLVAEGFVVREELGLEPTTLGRLASEFYMDLETARSFGTLAAASDPEDDGGVDESAVLWAVADAAEFDSVSARRDEREAVRAVLGDEGTDLEPGNRKVLAILRASMDGATPGELQSDAWVIRQNALRLLAALGAFLRELGSPAAANLVRRVEARVEHGVSGDAVGLTAVDGVGAGRAQKLASEGFTDPAALREAGVDGLVAAGMSDGVAERLLENARGAPDLTVDWGAFPDAVTRGESRMCEVGVSNDGGGVLAGIQVTVNGVHMTATTSYLGTGSVPVGVFGARDVDELVFEVTVSFPDRPLHPVTERRTVRVD
jgi:replicative superfamily II helicase